MQLSNTQSNGSETIKPGRPSDSQASIAERNRQTFRVALTGFGPFHNIAVNPSWQCLVPLQGLRISSPTGRSITLDCTEVPVVYEEVDKYCRERHGSMLDTEYKSFHYDLHIHIGVSASRKHISLERRARRFGYLKLDVTDQPSPSVYSEVLNRQLAGFTGEAWGDTDLHPERCSILDIDKLVTDMSVLWPGQFQASENAGLYLCEYIYYCSLATAQAAVVASQSPAKPVLFVHVPL